MARKGLWGVLRAALGVCVFAVTLALLMAPVLSSAAFLEWLTTRPPCGDPTG